MWKHKQKHNSMNDVTFDAYLDKRDYKGSLTMLEYIEEITPMDKLLWEAYIRYQLGEYSKAQEIYLDLLSGSKGKPPSECSLFLASVYLKMQMLKEAEEMALDGPEGNPLRNRLLYHISHHRSNKGKVNAIQSKLDDDDADDCISIASMEYENGNFQEAIDRLKNLSTEHKSFHAINVYVALCYYKLDYYDVSMDIIDVYLQSFPDSVLALNLKACLQFKLCDGAAAERELKGIIRNQSLVENNNILRHNTVVFSDGKHANETLPLLVDFIPEAKMNLAIFYLKSHKIDKAHEIMKDFTPTVPLEFTLKGIALAMKGQASNDERLLHLARELLQSVGQSPIDRDTVPGRQCMASYLFLENQFDEANIYFNSINNYLDDDDNFNWNYGISLAASRDYETAERILTRIKDEAVKNDTIFMCWLAKCFIANDKPELAWNVYSQNHEKRKKEADVQILKLVGNDCYFHGHFNTAMKAFDELSKISKDRKLYYDPIRGACIGAFQKFIAQIQGHLHINSTDVNIRERELNKSISVLRSVNNPQADHIAKQMLTWLHSNAHTIKSKYSS